MNAKRTAYVLTCLRDLICASCDGSTDLLAKLNEANLAWFLAGHAVSYECDNCKTSDSVDISLFDCGPCEADDHKNCDRGEGEHCCCGD